MAIPSENSIKPLKECFTKIIKQEPLNLTVKNVIKILENDLSIDTKNLDEHLIKTVLPNMIAHFIGSWPGWNKSNEYFTGKLTFKNWFQKFKIYMILKVNHLIKTSYQQALGELKQEKAEEDKAKAKTHLSHTVQTDDSIMKNFAPFCLGITCPPQLFNTLAFDAINEDHVHVQAHRPIPWSTLTIKEVIHWPNVAVVFESPYFSFRREVCIEYQRHFSAAKAWHKFVKNDFIKRITIIDENIKRKCYAANFIETFLICYKQILERLSEDELAKDAYHDISFLFNTFLMDIKEINIKDSIPTNTSIVFNIGKSVFTRNKKVKE